MMEGKSRVHETHELFEDQWGTANASVTLKRKGDKFHMHEVSRAPLIPQNRNGEMFTF